MSIPVYQHINVKTASFEELNGFLSAEMNLRHSVVINLKTLDLDLQRETIGLIENYFFSNNISFKFPYPIYFISDHETSITKLSLLHDIKELPKFFNQKESRMNVKEAHLAGKNKLLQQEVSNNDPSSNLNEIEKYSESHKVIFGLESERKFYRSILNRLLRT